MSFDDILKDLRETLVVVTEIQRRQAEVQKLQAQEIDAIRERTREHDARMARIEQNLEEITDKLNGLIGYFDGLNPKQP